jgi:MFS family permease
VWGCCLRSPTVEITPISSQSPARSIVIPVLGVTQIFAWGSTYYLLAVLAKPIVDDTGWPLAWIVGGLSLGLLTAGFVSPRVGDSIQHRGGRPVLAVSAILFTLGLTSMAVARSVPTYVASWVVLGAGMGAGLYDAAFATLGRLYGQQARTSIAMLTLFGGLASTICWPLSAILVSQFGWRGACLVYAGVHLCIVLPLYVCALPSEQKLTLTAGIGEGSTDTRIKNPVPVGSLSIFVFLAIAITMSAMISTVVSVHLLTILRLRDIGLAAAVALGALVGPTQVVARAIEMLISRYHHPLWTMVAATIFVAVGVGVLWTGLPIVSAALVFYGAGIGIESIARATVPLAVFGHSRYAAIMGRIAMPSLIAQAAAPSLGAMLMQRFGAGVTLGVLFATAIINAAIVIALFALLLRQKPNSSSASSKLQTDI